MPPDFSFFFFYCYYYFASYFVLFYDWYLLLPLLLWILAELVCQVSFAYLIPIQVCVDYFFSLGFYVLVHFNRDMRLYTDLGCSFPTVLRLCYLCFSQHRVGSFESCSLIDLQYLPVNCNAKIEPRVHFNIIIHI